MEKKILFAIPSLYRDDFRITGYSFGRGQKAACVVGSLRGNENQQLYVCAKLVEALQQLEAEGRIVPGKEIMVVPSANPSSMNIKKRFWSIDNTDINRMFPGYDQGETTQRIANGLFKAIQDFEFGIQFASFYMPGHFMPHARIMRIGDEANQEMLDLAKEFGLPYVISHDPRPYDTATLNYNWQVWDTKAFSLYTTSTNEVDKKSAEQAVVATLNFLSKQGLIHYHSHDGYISQVVKSRDIVTVRAGVGGFLDGHVQAGDHVRKGQTLAEIIHAYEGHVMGELVAPVSGTVLFARNENKTYQDTAVFKLILDMV
ncbi:MAG: succinylglutamate desuccinylase/aspartoacylase family protein [Eubacteriales bacterium]